MLRSVQPNADRAQTAKIGLTYLGSIDGFMEFLGSRKLAIVHYEKHRENDNYKELATDIMTSFSHFQSEIDHQYLDKDMFPLIHEVPFLHTLRQLQNKWDQEFKQFVSDEKPKQHLVDRLTFFIASLRRLTLHYSELQQKITANIASMHVNRQRFLKRIKLVWNARAHQLLEDTQDRFQKFERIQAELLAQHNHNVGYERALYGRIVSRFITAHYPYTIYVQAIYALVSRPTFKESFPGFPTWKSIPGAYEFLVKTIVQTRDILERTLHAAHTASEVCKTNTALRSLNLRKFDFVRDAIEAISKFRQTMQPVHAQQLIDKERELILREFAYARFQFEEAQADLVRTRHEIRCAKRMRRQLLAQNRSVQVANHALQSRNLQIHNEILQGLRADAVKQERVRVCQQTFAKARAFHECDYDEPLTVVEMQQSNHENKTRTTNVVGPPSHDAAATDDPPVPSGSSGPSGPSGSSGSATVDTLYEFESLDVERQQVLVRLLGFLDAYDTEKSVNDAWYKREIRQIVTVQTQLFQTAVREQVVARKTAVGQTLLRLSEMTNNYTDTVYKTQMSLNHQHDKTRDIKRVLADSAGLELVCDLGKWDRFVDNAHDKIDYYNRFFLQECIKVLRNIVINYK